MMADSDLMRLLDFDKDDLNANRRGQLSARQQARLRRTRSRATALNVLLLVFIVLCATGALYLAQTRNSIVGLLIGILLTVVNAILMARTLQNWLRVAEDLRTQRVEALSGAVERTVRVVGRAIIYVLKVGGREFIAPKAVFNTVPEGERWHFYRAPRSGTLLSAESNEASAEG